MLRIQQHGNESFLPDLNSLHSETPKNDNNTRVYEPNK